MLYVTTKKNRYVQALIKNVVRVTRMRCVYVLWVKFFFVCCMLVTYTRFLKERYFVSTYTYVCALVPRRRTFDAHTVFNVSEVHIRRTGVIR